MIFAIFSLTACPAFDDHFEAPDPYVQLEAPYPDDKEASVLPWSFSPASPRYNVNAALQRYIDAAGYNSPDYRARADLAARIARWAEVVDDRLTVYTSIDARDLPITALPPHMSVAGDVVVGGAQFVHSPVGLIVTGRLDLSDTAIERLGAGLRVDGSLRLPRGIRVIEGFSQFGGDLVASGTALEVVSGGIDVYGSFDLTGTAVASLPTEMWIGRSLILPESFSSLPNNLYVGADLDASRTTLASLPFDAQIVGNVVLQSAEPALISVAQVSHTTDPAPPNAGAVARLFREWRQLSSQPQLALNPTLWRLNTVAQTNLVMYSGKLQTTPAFRTQSGKTMMANLMMQLFAAMDEDPSFRELSVALITEANTSCGDRALDTLNQLEGALHLRRATSETMAPDALYDLGLSFLKLDTVRSVARQHARTIRNIEEIEVILAFESRLAESLQLPITPRGMLYERFAELGEVDYAYASGRALDAVANASICNAFFAQWEPWQAHLRREADAQFDYARLPARAFTLAEFNEDAVCPITRDRVADLAEPMCVGGSGPSEIYEAAAFLQWWTEYGTDPLTRSIVNPDALRRVTFTSP